MIKKYNNKSFCFGIPGIILQIGGRFIGGSTMELTALNGVVILTGTALLIIGLSYYAKAKGRHSAWCLMAFLSIIGLIVLALLKDKSSIQTE